MLGNKLAPAGWRVPNANDMDELLKFSASAKDMASSTGWKITGLQNAVGNGQHLNNSSGFNAFPAGWCYQNGSDGLFADVGTTAVFWKQCDDLYGYYYSINNESTGISEFRLSMRMDRMGVASIRLVRIEN